MSNEEVWHKARTKIYYIEWREGKVGEVVKCWAYTHILRDGEIIIRRPNGHVSVVSEREFFRDYEEFQK